MGPAEGAGLPPPLGKSSICSRNAKQIWGLGALITLIDTALEAF